MSESIKLRAAVAVYPDGKGKLRMFPPTDHFMSDSYPPHKAGTVYQKGVYAEASIYVLDVMHILDIHPRRFDERQVWPPHPCFSLAGVAGAGALFGRHGRRNCRRVVAAKNNVRRARRERVLY